MISIHQCIQWRKDRELPDSIIDEIEEMAVAMFNAQAELESVTDGTTYWTGICNALEYLRGGDPHFK